MKKLYFFIFLILLITNSVFAQDFTEIYNNSYFKNAGDSLNKLINIGSKARKTDYNKAISYYKKAINLIISSTNNQLQIATIYGNLGEIYYEQGNYKKALEYHINSHELYAKYNDQQGIAFSLNQIGTMYDILRKPVKALAALEESLKIRLLLGDSIYITNSYNNIGVYYYYQKKYETALEYYQKALSYVPISKINLQPGIYNNIGEIYCKQKKYKLAEKYFQKSVIAYKGSGDKYHMALISKNIGDLYIKQMQYEVGINYLKQSLKIANEIGSKLLIKEILEDLRDVQKKLGNYKEAYKYSLLVSNIKDTLFNLKHVAVEAEMNTKFETSRIEKENELLTKESLIRELKLEQNRLFLLLFSIFIIFLAIFLIFQIRKNKFKTATNKILRSKNNELAKLNATKNKFFSIISHDLKNPLSAFRNLTQALCENYASMEPSKVCNYLSQLNKSSSKQYDLLQNLLTWSQLQSEKITNNPEDLNLEYIISSNLEILKTNIVEKNIETIININKKHLVYADKNMINSVVINILTNAVKFTANNGKIKIVTKLIESDEDNKIIQVAISDTGIGLTKEDINKLFRIDVDHIEIGNSQEKGSGLGLILCKEFINCNNGKIWVESEIDKGSTFLFTLPATTNAITQ